MTPAPEDPAAFYERSYAAAGPAAERLARWRALSAVTKADHVLELCGRARLAPLRVAEIGCGDGALLAELAARGLGAHRTGFEISRTAAALARERPGIDTVGTFDGGILPAPRDAFDLAILSHVLEHVPDPPASLAEAARVAPAVLVEVPLEANVSARRAAKRAQAGDIGHVQAFDRAAMHALLAGAGLTLTAELDDPLPRRVHSFFATTRAARARATAKAGVRRAVTALGEPLAERLFTLHYACLGVRP